VAAPADAAAEVNSRSCSPGHACAYAPARPSTLLRDVYGYAGAEQLAIKTEAGREPLESVFD
jgi:hypothetical protein